jgi:hypothetical protein
MEQLAKYNIFLINFRNQKPTTLAILQTAAANLLQKCRVKASHAIIHGNT